MNPNQVTTDRTALGLIRPSAVLVTDVTEYLLFGLRVVALKAMKAGA